MSHSANSVVNGLSCKNYGRNTRHKYSRTDLLAMRYDSRGSRQRPHCASQIKLQNLGFWKTNFLPIDNSALNNSNELVSSKRSLRNRERANNYYQRFVVSDQFCEDFQCSPDAANTIYKSTNLDHRSISSSHLMPAFAKRRFGKSEVGADVQESSKEKPYGLLNCNEVETGLEERSATPTSPHSLKSRYSCPPSNPLIIPSQKSPYPSEWDRCDIRSNNLNDEQSSGSPSFLPSRQMQEKRIGSGRLLRRDDNWEYKGQDNESKDKTHHGNNQMYQRQRSFSGKHSDRSFEKTERRLIDAKDNENHIETTKTAQGIRRITNKDKLNLVESNMSKGKRLYLHQVNNRHEPEWFIAGPTSQLETIELHGFDDSEDNEEKIKIEPIIDGFQSKVLTGNKTECSEHVFYETNNDTEDKTIENFPQTKRVDSLKPTTNVEVEFNFDAYLNLDPMDYKLMGDRDTKSEMAGSSRFSRWFGDKINENNVDIVPIGHPKNLNTHCFPSVKDLEAQMTKVNLRRHSPNEYANNNPETLWKVQKEALVSTETEAFQMLLQQLGAQSKTVSLPEMAQPSHDICQPTANTFVNQNTNCLDNEDLQVKIDAIENKQAKVNHLQKKWNQYGKKSEQMQIHNIRRSSTQNPSAHTYHCTSNTTQQDVQKEETTHNVGQTLSQKRIEIEHLIQNLSAQSSLNQGINNARQGNSPTPLAFTPTSVLRKMTADKDTSPSPSNIGNHQCQYPNLSRLNKTAVSHNLAISPKHAINVQPRMILGGNYAIQHNVNSISNQIPQSLQPQISQSRCQQAKWAYGTKSLGRPILKGTLHSVPQQISHIAFPPNAEMDKIHGQRVASIQSAEPCVSNEHIHIAPLQNYCYIDDVNQHYLQPPLHARHRILQNQLCEHRLQNFQLNSQCSHENNVSENVAKPTINYPNDRLSTSGNKLAQWFSPELLARASAGKLPHLNMNQALSLEEFERSIQHSSTAVHN